MYIPRPHQKEGETMAGKDEYGFITDAQKRAQAKYDEKTKVGLYLKLNVKTYKDILQWLWSQRSKQGAIKELIRQDIERKKQKQD